jgi:predicted TPR repeat methyltransferase
VLVYHGRLDYILGTTSKALKGKNGLFAFTLESLEEIEKEENEEGREEGWLLRPTGRYAHRREYVEGLLGKVGMEVVKVEAVVGRKDKGQPIPGWLFLCRKR